jgi:hypothetical protein
MELSAALPVVTHSSVGAPAYAAATEHLEGDNIEYIKT